MIKASIISIGNELLSGQTLDSNRAYLSKKLLGIGVPVVSGYTVSDNVDSISRSLHQSSEDADIILVTGGLGPTDDDVTRGGLAQYLGVELELREDLLEKITRYFSSRKLRMVETNNVQAYLPAGTDALSNELGTAPGIAVKAGGKSIYAMPGVPSEMKAMFEDSVLGGLEALTSGQAVVVKKLKCFGTGESKIAEMLGDLMERGRNPLVNCTVNKGVITLHIISTASDKVEAEQEGCKVETELRRRLGRLVYGSGEQSLAEVVGKQLAARGKTIALAESCTGGLVAKLLTDVSGSSEYFRYGWVTYSNEAKIKELDVSAELIEKEGAVSEEVSKSMALGAKKISGADYAIGITGIAGPGGGGKEKPVGLVHISVAADNNIESSCFTFSHDRNFIRYLTAQTSLNMVRLALSR